MKKNYTPSRPKSLLKQRYSENPFTSEDGFRVPLKNKSEVIQTDGPASVMVGEEKIAVAQIRKITTVDSEHFVKLFTAQLDRFFDLNPTTLRIVTVLIQNIGKIRIGDGDQVYLTEKNIGDALREHGLNPPSSASYYRAMEELIKKGFIAPSNDTPLYYINPAIFFNGDRVKFVTELRRKKMSKTEKLESAGQAALPLDYDPDTGDVNH